MQVRVGGAAAAGLLFCLTAYTALAQGSFGDQAMMPRDANPNWDVVTVKTSDPNNREDSFVVVGRHVTIKNRTMENLLLIGYSLHKTQIVGAPEWVRTEHFDVDGVPDIDGRPNLQQIQRLMQSLLTERFGLKLHLEQQMIPVYALTAPKGSTKMAPSKGDPNGLPDERRLENGVERTIQMTNANMGDLVLMINDLDRPVVDQTRLAGRFDFQLRYTFDELRSPADRDVAPGIFTAVQEQLGLKLEPAKATTNVMVIDKVERPSAN